MCPSTDESEMLEIRYMKSVFLPGMLVNVMLPTENYIMLVNVF